MITFNKYIAAILLKADVGQIFTDSEAITFAKVEVLDDTIPCINKEPIGSRTTIESIVTISAVNNIVTDAPVKIIMSSSAEEYIISCASSDGVISLICNDQVITSICLDQIVPLSPAEKTSTFRHLFSCIERIGLKSHD